MSVYTKFCTGPTSANWNNNILSDGKSDYFEGEVIPHVFAYKASNNAPLVHDQSYSFNITYNHYQANTNAGGFAYITTFDVSRDPGLFANNAPVSDAAFTNGGGMQGTFYTSSNIDITAVSGVSYTGSGTKDGHVTVTFTYTGTTTTSGYAEIYYGLMIAAPGVIPDQGKGSTDGANAWTGGSLQTTVDIGGSGATSIQLAPSAIIVGEISGMKFNDLNGDGVRDANGVDNILGNADDERGLSDWTIFLDTNGDGDLDPGEISTTTASDGTYSFSVTPDADKLDSDNDPYLVREVQQAGWTQTTANPAAILITSIDPTETGVNFGNQWQVRGIAIDKQFVDVNGNAGELANSVGDVINYQMLVTNTGNTALDNVQVSDPLLTNETFVSGDTDADGRLDVSETWTYTGSYTVTQADLDGEGNAGSDHDIDNTATATADNTPSDDDSEQVPLVYNPALNIEKAVYPSSQVARFEGDVITYQITVDNTGNVSLTGVTVTDPFANAGSIQYLSGDVDTDNKLDVDELWTYSAAHTVTQAELTAGGNWDTNSDGKLDSLRNVATADSNETGPDTDDAIVPVLPPVTFTGSPYYNFPNSLEQIQVKGVEGQGSFFINSKTYMMWDFYTKDTTLAAFNLDPASYGSNYAGLTVSVAEIWKSSDDHSAIFRVYVANETNASIQFNNSTDVVYYDIIGDSKEKGIIDLINGDPLNGNFNNFSNIENAVTSANNNGFIINPANTDFSASTTTVKVWASSDPTGVLDDEAPASTPYTFGSGDDLIYLRNNPSGTVETAYGGGGDDQLLGRDGSDVLYGGDGNDWLYGSLGNDTLHGDAGADRLFGAYGHDQLYGGTGADVFILRAGDFDTIHDFNAAEGDKILIWWESRYDTGVLSGGTDYDSEVSLTNPIYTNTSYDTSSHLLYLDGNAIAEFVDIIPAGLDTRATDASNPEIIIT